MLNCVIIDDEIDAIEVLTFYLNSFCQEIKIVGNAQNVIDGVKLILSKTPDLVFLDIDLLGGTGFDVLDCISEKNFQTIFITSHNDFAIKAIRANALDYILKPIVLEELITAVSNANCKIKNVEKPNCYFENEVKAKSKLKVNSSLGIEFISLNEIVKLEANGNYCKIYLLDNKKINALCNLTDLHFQINDNKFVRTHNSQVVNLVNVLRYNPKDGGYIEMIDGSFALLSRRKKDEFLKLMETL